MAEINIFEAIKLSPVDMDSTITLPSIRTDNEVVQAISTGDERAVNKAVKVLYGHQQFFETYVINRLINGKHLFNREETLKDLEEIYRDSILLFIEKVKKEPPEFVVGDKGSIKTFLFTIGKFKYLTLRRKRIRDIKEKFLYRNTQTDSEMTEDIFHDERDETAASVQQAMKELDDKCYELLKLRFNKGLAPREIPIEDTKNPNTISQRIFRCREKLKKVLIAKYNFNEKFA